MKKLLSLIIMLGLTSCLFQNEPVKTSTTSSGDGGSTQGGDTTGTNGNTSGTNGSTTTGTSGSTTGSTTTGTTGNNNFPNHQFELFLSGHKAWVPGNYTDNLAQETQITPQEAKILFASDSKLDIRLKVRSQPFPTTGEKLCWDRQTGQSPMPSYTKLRFRVRLRDILCNNPDPNNTNNCLSGFYLGNPYAMRIIEPVDVNSYSEVLQMGHLRNNSPYGTTVEVDQVQSDSACIWNESYCPANRIVQTGSCWHMTMEVATDYTQGF